MSTSAALKTYLIEVLNIMWEKGYKVKAENLMQCPDWEDYFNDGVSAADAVDYTLSVF